MVFRRRFGLTNNTQNGAPTGTRSKDDEGAAAQRAATGVGAVLRAERERQGLRVQDVAVTLRLRRVMVEALEAGQVNRLPGATYAVAFVRSYSEYLGLDRDEIVARFRDEVEGLVQPVELTFPISAAESRLPGGAIVMVSLVVAVGAYVFWYLGNGDDNVRPPRVAAVPPPLSALVDRPPPLQPTPIPSAQNAVAATVANRPEPILDVPSDLGSSGNAESTTTAAPPHLAALPPPSSPDARTTQPASAARFAGRIMLRARADCWLRVRDAAGNVLLTRMMKPGDELTPPDREGLSMFVGSAGALEVMVDGKPAPALGALGAVRRDVPLDPDRLLAGIANSPRPASIAPPAPAGRPARPGSDG